MSASYRWTGTAKDLRQVIEFQTFTGNTSPQFRSLVEYHEGAADCPFTLLRQDERSLVLICSATAATLARSNSSETRAAASPISRRFA